jgi:hypothetical protein
MSRPNTRGIIGVDIGEYGAIVAMTQSKIVAYDALIDTRGLRRWRGIMSERGAVARCADLGISNYRVLIESQGQSKQLASAAAAISGGFLAYGFEVEFVAPVTWQKLFMKRGTDKGGKHKPYHVQIVERLGYPCPNLKPSGESKYKHDGYADAVMIALWGLQKYYSDEEE